jgi:hypothetical protein
MSETTIYIKGSSGFKAALTDKLSDRWTNSSENPDKDTVSFSVNKDMTLNKLKSDIGNELVLQYDLSFLDELPEGSSSYTPVKYVPGQAFKMTIWANQDLMLTPVGSRLDREEK